MIYKYESGTSRNDMLLAIRDCKSHFQELKRRNKIIPSALKDENVVGTERLIVVLYRIISGLEETK